MATISQISIAHDNIWKIQQKAIYTLESFIYYLIIIYLIYLKNFDIIF